MSFQIPKIKDLQCEDRRSATNALTVRSQISISLMTSSDPKRDLPLICGSQSFTVKKTLLIEKFGLFLEKPDLLGRDSYDVQTNVPAQVFSDFLKAAHGTEINISEINAPLLLDLCNEFGFEPLRADCAPFLQPTTNLNPPSHFLEEQISLQEVELAAVHSEIAELRDSAAFTFH
jgi:hypothetical protein